MKRARQNEAIKQTYLEGSASLEQWSFGASDLMIDFEEFGRDRLEDSSSTYMKIDIIDLG